MAPKHFFAIVNPAAGGGRCAKLAPAALERLRSAGVEVEVAETRASGDATRLARDAHKAGERDFLAVGGDGTSYEIVNGIFPLAAASPENRCALAFLPLGTGNSFLRDFHPQQASNSTDALVQSLLNGEKRTCDVIRLHHSTGDLYYINLLTLGFAADAAEFANRHLKGFGYTGYAISVLACLARLDRRAFPLRADGAPEFDRRPCLFLAFSNTKFTGGNMMISPNADSSDGLIEYVRWGPIGRIGLLRNFAALFDGTHISHPLASRAAVREVEFSLDEAVNAMIDGESLRLKCERLSVLPSALDVIV
ncbi:MAG TPA: diacylglycerol kinase family protein [Candidatus Acidoferrales bacterium]|nr:diacylglycerol kinase family protein [Candidatus Acidoferrales bacterium]